MKILLINTTDFGGAALACKRLHYGLVAKGMDSNVLVRTKKNNWKKTSKYVAIKSRYTLREILNKGKKKILKRVKLYKNYEFLFLIGRAKSLELFSYPSSDCNIMHSDIYKNSQIINLHWVSNFIDFNFFFKNNLKPVVWTLHDMNPFTGGEHYVENFSGINELGFPVKRELTFEELSVNSANLKLKAKALQNVSNLTLVAPSEWLYKEAKKSELFKGFPIYLIANGINTSIFDMRGQKKARESMNLPIDKKIVLFVAEALSSNRKGFVYLQKAFELIEQENVILCAVGSNKNNICFSPNFIQLGIIDDEVKMSTVYSAADVFVIPSLMDNLPNTVVESLVCGTPVIGFPTGGIVDMIVDGENGYLAEEISVNALVNTLNKFLKNVNCFDKNKIRKDAVSKYDESIQSQKYCNLFTNILQSNARN